MPFFSWKRPSRKGRPRRAPAGPAKKRFFLNPLVSGCTLLITVWLFALPASWPKAPANKDDLAASGGNGPRVRIGIHGARRDLSISPKGLNLGGVPYGKEVVLTGKAGRFFVISSIDTDLQAYTRDLLGNSGTVQAAAVVLSPKDGRILAMASYDKEGKDDNLCLQADFPAASLFKIVSAAAALDSAGFTPDRPVFYVGRKYTLYKGQLKDRKGKYGAKIPFRKAFASSINSIFGKVGIYHLGREKMSEYSRRFLFNRSIPFDLPVEKSTTLIPDDAYGLAEIASGFNKRTRISPLHAALLAAAAANDGIIMAPYLIERVLNDAGDILYVGRPTPLATPISRETAADLRVLMRETVENGTCRKTWRWLRRKEAFKDIDLGAKTGNINDRKDRFKYDWLSAFAIPPNGEEGICVAVLSVHGKALGVRAYRLARYIINYYLGS